MKLLKKIFKWFLCFLLIPVVYLLVSLVFTFVTVNEKEAASNADKIIYLHSTGVHLDIAIGKKDVSDDLLKDLKHVDTDSYLSFGWGDENFYINTPTWNDLTFKTAFVAMFLKSSSLMHVTRYKIPQSNWTEIKITASELEKLNAYLLNSFKRNNEGFKILLKNKGYSSQDDFYRAYGSYSCFNTCNSWVNTAFKKSDLKACLWTPFDFGLLNKYE